MGPADLKERLKHREKKSRRIPTLRWRMAILRPAIFAPTASPKRRARFSAASERKLEIAQSSRHPIQHRGAKGRPGADGPGQSALARGKRRAEHWMAHEEALALARSGRLQAARRSSNRAVDLALQERRTRGGSELPGRTSGVGGRLRECCRREKERHGGARTFEGPGCRIRRRPCPGSFGRFFSIGGARRRFRKALPGRYFCEIYLRTGSSRVSRTGAGQARRQCGAAASRSAAMSWR